MIPRHDRVPSRGPVAVVHDAATAATAATTAVVVGAAVAAGTRPVPLPPDGAEHFQDGKGLLRIGVRARRAVVAVAAAVVDSAAAVVLQEFLGGGYHLPSISRARTPLPLCGLRWRNRRHARITRPPEGGEPVVVGEERSLASHSLRDGGRSEAGAEDGFVSSDGTLSLVLVDSG